MNNDINYAGASVENINLTMYDEPPERCTPRYENRVFTDSDGNEMLRCVKIAIPDNIYYEESCGELEFINEDFKQECVID